MLGVATLDTENPNVDTHMIVSRNTAISGKRI